ncbi:hypothetical protein ACOSQ2_032025 [Xanthoceras sorbifolium]
MISTYNDDYLNWKKIDQLLVSWLMSTLSSSILGRVTQCMTACEVWNTVTNMFSQQSMARIMHLRAQLQSLKKRAMKISDYIVKIKGITDSLMAAGQVLTEQDLVAYILGGLGLEFDPIVCNIASKKGDITLQDAQFLLMGYESRLEQYHSSTTIDVSQASVNTVSKSANFVRGSSYPNNNNRGRSRGRRGGRGGRYFNQRLTCQLCGKAGHFSAICYHRFDQSFSGNFGKQQLQNQSNVSSTFNPLQGNIAQQFSQPQMEYYATPYSGTYSGQNPNVSAYMATPSTVGDASWYVDSGATNHITPDFNSMHISSDYRGQNFGESIAPRSTEGWSIPTHSSKG